MLEHFRSFARYNQWANRQLYAAAAELTPAEWQADRGVFFKSLCGTLNHILVADRVWLSRFEGGSIAMALDTILHPALADLDRARAEQDAQIIAFTEALDDERLSGGIVYRNLSGREFRQPLAPALAHVFNHQTHHRGQAHAILTGLGRSSLAIDYIYYLREQAS